MKHVLIIVINLFPREYIEMKKIIALFLILSFFFIDHIITKPDVKESSHLFLNKILLGNTQYYMYIAF